MNILVKY